MRIFIQRRRKILMRLGAILLVGCGGLLAVLPRADAYDAKPAWSGDAHSFLLSPELVSSGRFAMLRAPTQG